MIVSFVKKVSNHSIASLRLGGWTLFALVYRYVYELSPVHCPE